MIVRLSAGGLLGGWISKFNDGKSIFGDSISKRIIYPRAHDSSLPQRPTKS